VIVIIVIDDGAAIIGFAITIDVRPPSFILAVRTHLHLAAIYHVLEMLSVLVDRRTRNLGVVRRFPAERLGAIAQHIDPPLRAGLWRVADQGIEPSRKRATGGYHTPHAKDRLAADSLRWCADAKARHTVAEEVFDPLSPACVPTRNGSRIDLGGSYRDGC